MSPRATGSQTVGPYFRIGMSWGYVDTLVADDDDRRITIKGRLLDGDGTAVPDGCLEIWQADGDGKYASPDEPSAFKGFARVATDAGGAFRVTTIKPGTVAGQAPHLVVSVFARGLLKRLVTRMYFPDDAAHATDPVLALVPPERRHTLIARPGRAGMLEWNVVLQGEDETVFFELAP
jgi:protocatechuate 3,4-dioxygenase alpha subunit